MRIARLTTGGKIGNAAIKGYASISPDGKYVVFRTTELGKDSLWVRQVLTGSLVKIVPDLPGKVGGTTFSRDGEFIYYSMFEKDPRGTLYQVPVLGGTPQRIMAGVTSAVTFSPDGQQLAFVRTEPQESKLMVANTDGTGERTIATRKLPEHFPPAGGPSWSPDGKTIACGAETFRGNVLATVVSVPAAGGAEKAYYNPQLGIRLTRALAARWQRFNHRGSSRIDFGRHTVVARLISWRRSSQNHKRFECVRHNQSGTYGRFKNDCYDSGRSVDADLGIGSDARTKANHLRKI